MFPIVHIGSCTWSAFTFFIASGVVIAALYIVWQAGRRGISRAHMLALVILAAFVGVIGMRLFHVLVEAPRYYWEHPWHIFHLSKGGFVSWGAMIGIWVSTWVYLRAFTLPMLRYLDSLALGFPIVVFFTRLACLGVGCCYGKPTDFPIHIVFTNASTAAARYYPGIPLHAVQLYGMAKAIVLFILLYAVSKRQRFHGQLIAAFVISYGFLRFLLEFLRGDIDRGIYFDGLLSTGQVMGVLFILVGVCCYHRFARDMHARQDFVKR